MKETELGAWAEAVVDGQRRALARALTLVESSRSRDVQQAHILLEHLLPRVGDAMRIGVTGPPGVGKSTLLEALGLHLLEAGHSVAVLAVDPTSVRSGGSLLGDKTRMTHLSRDRRAFIRPSPTGGTLGGVTARTAESILLCEAAGFDVVLVETVGVGQSEVAVADVVDRVVLLTLPGSGDELQGIKRGVLEICDVICVTKADGPMRDAARKAQRELQSAVRILGLTRDGQPVDVRTASAQAGEGVVPLWDALLRLHEIGTKTGTLASRRRAQRVRQFETALATAMLTELRARPDFVERRRQAIEDVGALRALPSAAAHRLASRLV